MVALIRSDDPCGGRFVGLGTKDQGEVISDRWVGVWIGGRDGKSDVLLEKVNERADMASDVPSWV